MLGLLTSSDIRFFVSIASVSTSPRFSAKLGWNIPLIVNTWFMLPWSELLECLLIYLRKRSLGGFTSFIIERKSPGHEVAVQGLKSYNAIGWKLLSSETKWNFSAASTRLLGLTLKIMKHNSQYIVTREPTIITFKVVWYVYNVARWHRTTRSSA